MKKLLIFIFGMILFISCAEPLENYKGYIVAKKYFIMKIGYYLSILMSIL